MNAFWLALIGGGLTIVLVSLQVPTLVLVSIVLTILWGLAGIKSLPQNYRAIIKLGSFYRRTARPIWPGWIWVVPLLESVAVQFDGCGQVKNIEIADVYCRDGFPIRFTIKALYRFEPDRITDPEMAGSLTRFLPKMTLPEGIIETRLGECLRYLVSQMTCDEIFSAAGRQHLTEKLQREMTERLTPLGVVLSQYGGILIQNTDLPEDLQQAYAQSRILEHLMIKYHCSITEAANIMVMCGLSQKGAAQPAFIPVNGWTYSGYQPGGNGGVKHSQMPSEFQSSGATPGTA